MFVGINWESSVFDLKKIVFFTLRSRKSIRKTTPLFFQQLFSLFLLFLVIPCFGYWRSTVYRNYFHFHTGRFLFCGPIHQNKENKIFLSIWTIFYPNLINCAHAQNDVGQNFSNLGEFLIGEVVEVGQANEITNFAQTSEIAEFEMIAGQDFWCCPDCQDWWNLSDFWPKLRSLSACMAKIAEIADTTDIGEITNLARLQRLPRLPAEIAHRERRPRSPIEIAGLDCWPRFPWFPRLPSLLRSQMVGNFQPVVCQLLSQQYGKFVLVWM